jgi:serine/threonine protein kinase
MTAAPHFRNALPLQSMLQEYRIDQVLGAGGFGITYRARDTNLDKDVALKEYLPGQLALRTADGNVVAQGTTHEAGYRWGLARFLQEARTLAKFSHPHIVRVLRYFEANATAYMVMDYEQGDPLKTVLQHDPRPPEQKLKTLVAPLLDGLAAVHATGFLHRDIKPDNIFVRADGRPVLIDFGAARQALGGETKSLTSILTPGYAPLEQYSGEGRQGPWTDLYAMGGVLYRAVTDRNPPDAVARLRGDPVAAGIAEARGRYSEAFLRAIEWALALDEKQRPQSVEQWKAALLGEATVIAPRSVPGPAPTRDEPTVKVAPPSRRRRWPWILGAVALALIAANVVRKQRSEPPPAPRTEPARAETPKSVEPARPKPVPPAAAKAAAPAPASAPAESADAGKAQRFRQETEAEFRAADANGDGYLSRDESARFPALARGFQRVDADGDGRISPREFTQARRVMLERRLKKSDD